MIDKGKKLSTRLMQLILQTLLAFTAADGRKAPKEDHFYVIGGGWISV